MTVSEFRRNGTWIYLKNSGDVVPIAECERRVEKWPFEGIIMVGGPDSSVREY